MLKVSCAIIVSNGKVLITQRNIHQTNPCYWEFPGGKIKPDETPDECIRREIFEELNIIIDPKSQIPSFKGAVPDGNILLIPFICYGFKGEIQLKEHQSYKLVNIKELTGYNFTQADIGLCRYLVDNSQLISI